MNEFKPGDVIEHRLMPGFTMTVKGTRDCETDWNRPEPHLSYNVTDPEGNDDWLCAHDVQKPGEGLAWSGTTGGGTGPRGAAMNHGPSFSCGSGWPKLTLSSVPRPGTAWYDLI